MKKFIIYTVMVFCTCVGLADDPIVPQKLGDLEFDTLMYTKSDIDKLLMQRSGCDCPSNLVALFIIPLNYTSSGAYEHFELKASTNNFYAVESIGNSTEQEYVRLQYYSQSEIADKGISIPETEGLGGEVKPNSSLDRMWIFACTGFHDNPSIGSFSGDVRSWYYIGSTLCGIGRWLHKPTTIAVLVDTTCLERHKESRGGEWLSKENQELVWSWTRYYYDGTERHSETESGGTRPLWRPIAPDRWYSEIPGWAAKQIPNFRR